MICRTNFKQIEYEINTLKRCKIDRYDVLERILKIQGVEILSAFTLQPLTDSCAEIGIRPIFFCQERAGVS